MAKALVWATGRLDAAIEHGGLWRLTFKSRANAKHETVESTLPITRPTLKRLGGADVFLGKRVEIQVLNGFIINMRLVPL